MKYRAHYTDGSAVDIHSDSELAARAHADGLEDQELARATAMDPPIKYTKRTVEFIELLDAEGAVREAEPTKSKSKK